jgi:hypothetical protein
MPTFMPSQQCEDTEISDDNERLVWTISPGKDFSVHSLSWKMLTYLVMVSGFSTVVYGTLGVILQKINNLLREKCLFCRNHVSINILCSRCPDDAVQLCLILSF